MKSGRKVVRALSLVIGAVLAGCGDSGGFTDLTPATQFVLDQMVTDAATGMMRKTTCAEHPGVYSVNEAALRKYRYYEFCQADGETLIDGLTPVPYGTAIHMARFRWASAHAGSYVTTIYSFYADDDSDGFADMTKRWTECWSAPPLGVVASTNLFPATVGQAVCVQAGFEDSFPVHYAFESLSPLQMRVTPPDGTAHVIEMVELAGSADVAKPAVPTCGISTCFQLD